MHPRAQEQSQTRERNPRPHSSAPLGPCLPQTPRQVSQLRTEAANPCPTSAAPLPHRGHPLPEAPRRRGRRPATAPEKDVVCGVEGEEAVQGNEKRADPFPGQPHPTQANRQAAATKERGRR